MKSLRSHKKYKATTSANGHFFSPQSIYPKLTINAPDDQYEQEADAMAEKVMTVPEFGIQRKCAACDDEKESIQRQELNESPSAKAIGDEEEDMLQMKSENGGGMHATPALQSQLNASKGGGATLPEGTNHYMSNAFGTDFSGVRVHTGQQANKMNQSIQAKAFTHGSDIFFKQGQYNPGSLDGKQLLAHELTHVVQQSPGRGIPQNIQRSWWEGALIGGGIGVLAGGIAGGLLGGGLGALVGGLAGAAVGAGIGALAGHFAGRKNTPETPEETPEEPAVTEQQMEAYIEYLHDTGNIEAEADSKAKARGVVARWQTGNAGYVLSASMQILIVQELLNGTISADDRESVLTLLRNIPIQEFNAIIQAVGEENITGAFPEESAQSVEQLIENRQNSDAGDSTEVFDSNAVYDFYRESHANSLSETRDNCIIIIRRLVPQLFADNPQLAQTVQTRLNALSEDDLKMTRVGEVMSNLGLVSHDIDITFNNGNGNNEPTEMNGSAWDEIMAATGDQQGWHIFGMAPFNGYHSVTILVHKRENDTYLYWADQWNTNPPDPTEDFREDDSISGFRRFDREGLDGWITNYTNSRWNRIYSERGARWNTTTHIWKFRSALNEENTVDNNESIQRKAVDKTFLTTNNEVLQRDQQDEEQRLEQNSISQFSHNQNLDTYPTQMANALNRVPSIASALSTVDWWGYKLWEAARSLSRQTNNDRDDRPLYWTRLRMRLEIRNFNPENRFNVSDVQRNQLVNRFNRSSRGMPTRNGRLRWIPNAKKILISGFDPFRLNENIQESNPSGAVALALDGEIIRHSSGIIGQIQSVVMPVSFDYFDQGHVEQFFRPYIQGSNLVNMVMTISQGGREYELEETAARFRAPDIEDNENESETQQNLSPGDPTITSSLPRGAMRREGLNRGPQPTLAERRSVVSERNYPQSTVGSGGVYLSNEIFYRTSLLRTSNPDISQRDLPVGHLHIPGVNEQNNAASQRNEIINRVRLLIRAALPHI